MKTGSSIPAIAAGVLVLALSPLAQAHPGHSNGGGWTSGFVHPFTGLDHVAAMFAIGLWAACIGGRALWQLPVMFLGAMLVGGALVGADVFMPVVELGVSLSVVVLGLALALSMKPPASAALSLVAAFAICHGYAHVAELGTDRHATSVIAFVAGMLLATASLQCVGIAAGLTLHRAHRDRLIELAGAAIAGVGVLFCMAIA